jgi:hypothetical protein
MKRIKDLIQTRVESRRKTDCQPKIDSKKPPNRRRGGELSGCIYHYPLPIEWVKSGQNKINVGVSL